MKKYRQYIAFGSLPFAFCLLLSVAVAQPAFAPAGFLSANWIVPPDVPGHAYGVFHFRKTLMLTEVPSQFTVHVTADNRYRLFVNGREVGLGPARGDTQHWYYDTYDLAPFLNAGKNTVAVQVWNMGEHAPLAQFSYRTAFLMQGDGPAEQVLNTDKTWKVIQNPAYQPLPNDNAKLWTYIVVGSGDRVDGATYPWGWEQPKFDDTAWPQATQFGFPAKLRSYGSDGNWGLMPRPIPMLESRVQHLARVRVAKSVERGGKPKEILIDTAFFSGHKPFWIDPNCKATILFDQNYLTNGYPELRLSGGKRAHVRLTYVEGLMDDRRQKHHRDSIEGLKMIGFEDEFTSDGSFDRVFRPLWFRTWRYIQLEVETKDEPLKINSLNSVFTGYPFVERASFRSNDPSLARIWETGWRTARLCAGETYFDCPYYEQLQYTGDTRIQSLLSLYVAGDDRLMRRAIQDFADSRLPEGLTQSRYPCNDPQVIPPFSLFWVSMVRDFWWHRRDDNFVKRQLPTIEGVLAWHEARLAPNNLNGRLEWWNFVDWCWPWNEAERIGGVPDGAKTGSSILSLQFAATLQQAADLMQHYGFAEKALHYRQLSTKICTAVRQLCWDSQRGLLADTPAKKSFSQHANIWGVLTDAIPVVGQRAVLQKIMTEKDLTAATFYFRFYLFEALQKAGMGDQFLPQLDPWRGMLDIGLTTFAEQPEPTRSDCHAWSASPNYELLSLVCGIRPASPGFATVRIVPSLGDLEQVEGKMPHPAGEISVSFQRKKEQVTGFVALPTGVSGVFVWQGKERALRSGRNVL